MNEIYSYFQMNTTENLSSSSSEEEDGDINLCSNDTTTKSMKSLSTYRKHLYNSTSLYTDTINTFNTGQYYPDLSNKSNNNNSTPNKTDFIKYSNDFVESSKLNPILAIASHQWFDRLFHSNSYATSNHTHSNHHQQHHVHHHPPAPPPSHVHHVQRGSYNHQHQNQNQQTCGLNFESPDEHFARKRLNSNLISYNQTTENDLLTTHSTVIHNHLESSRFNEVQNENTMGDGDNDNNKNTNDETNENDVTNTTKYDYASATPKLHSSSSSSSNFDYQTEFNFTTSKFTNYSNCFTERQDKQPNIDNNNSNSFGNNDPDTFHTSGRLHPKLMINEVDEPIKKSCSKFNNECNPINVHVNHSIRSTLVSGSFLNTKIDESCSNSMTTVTTTTTNSGNLKLYNNNSTNNQSSKSPPNDSSMPSPRQLNSQRTLNTTESSTTTTLPLLEWHLMPENNFITKIKSDHDNEHLLKNYKPQSIEHSNSFINNPIRNNTDNNNNPTTNNKDSVYEEKLSTSTDRHSPPLSSYSSQSTENLNEESIRGNLLQPTSYLHSHHTDKVCSDLSNEFIWKTNHPTGELISYENELSYIKNHWNSSHHHRHQLLMNKLRFGGNLNTTNSSVFSTTNSNTNSNSEINYPEHSQTDILDTSHRNTFDSMIPCISHNFLTNFTKTSYDIGQANCLQENFYDLPSNHLTSYNSIVGSFTNTNFFNLDNNSSISSSNHPVSTSSSDHNRLDEVYDRTEQCLSLNSLSQHHHNHHPHHPQFMMMNNCSNDYSMNLSNDVTMVTGTPNDFKTGLNYYLLPPPPPPTAPVNGFTTSSDPSYPSSHIITNNGATSNFKNRFTGSNGYSSQSFNHSNILSCNHTNHTSIYRHPVELDYNPRELEAFSELFKQRRIKLGVTQADVGKALGNLKISGVGSLSQSTICRFESLTLSHNNMIALKPVLQAWLEEAEAEAANSRSNHSSIYDLDEERRRKRTSITDSEKRSLEAFFSIQPRPSSEKISQIAEKLNLKKNVVRVWFCNQRQKQKRMKFSTLGMLHHSTK